MPQLSSSFKYSDSPTVYGTVDGKTYAFSSESDFKSVGGDFGKVQTINQTTPGLVKSSPVYSSQPTSTFASFSTPSTSSVTNSATKVDEAVTNLGNNINKASTSTFDINTLLESFRQQDEKSRKDSEDLNKFYEQRRTDLEKRREDELKRLDAEYTTETAKKESQYQKDVQPYQQRLQLLKDTPYGTNATLEEELKLKLGAFEQTHKLEMDTLFNKRQSSIALAQSAYEDKDFALAESQIKNAKETEKLIYERQQDFLTMALKLQEEERARQKQEFQQMKDARDFMMEYGIKQPMFAIGGTVFNSQTLQPEYENVNGEFRRISDGKVYENEAEFFADSGIRSFGQIQDIAQGSSTEQKIVLDLIKDYPDAKIYPGMSLEQAYSMLSGSAKYRKEIKSGSGSNDVDRGEAASEISKIFREAKGEDKYINPDLYRDQRDAWAAKFKTLDSFYKEFPVYKYIHPDNRVGDLAEEDSFY